MYHLNVPPRRSKRYRTLPGRLGAGLHLLRPKLSCLAGTAGCAQGVQAVDQSRDAHGKHICNPPLGGSHPLARFEPRGMRVLAAVLPPLPRAACALGLASRKQDSDGGATQGLKLWQGRT